MRIGIVSGTIGLFDATGKYTYYLAKALGDAGYEVHCYADVDSRPSGLVANELRLRTIWFQLVKRKIRSVLMHVPALHGFLLRVLASLPDPTTRKVSAELAKCDVVWIVYSSFRRLLLVPIAMKVRRSKIKIVFDYHGVTPANLVHPGLAVAQRIDIEKLPAFAANSDLLVAHSKFAANELIRDSATTQKVAVIPLFVDPLLSRRSVERPVLGKSSADGAPKRILSVGRVSPHKRIDILIRAAALLKREGWKPKITIVGAVPALHESERHRLEKLAASLGMEGDIVFTGLISHDSLKQLYAQSDVLVITSAHEGFCLPIVEAMTFGLPVVASNVGSMPEVLGNAGELFDFPSHEHLAAKLSELFSKRSLMRHSSMAGRQRAALFSYDNFARNVKNVVAGLESTRRVGPV
jgi:glycosyltransferase involved in cell wall biosynthesis